MGDEQVIKEKTREGITEINYVIGDGDIKFSAEINFYELFENMDDHQKEEFVESITYGRVLETAKKRLTGKSNNWSSEDGETRLEFLSSIEDTLLSGYKWGFLRNLLNNIRVLSNNRDIYYKMIGDQQNREFFRDWMDRHGVDSKYNMDTDAFEKKIDDCFAAMVEGRK